jgi:hypothetical protein
MAVYPIQELKNLITDRIIDNHTRAIDGIEFQEVLLDILDSLESYTDDSMESPAVNYYVSQILWDKNTGALTLVRAGGITPANISVDLDDRYRLLSQADHRSDEVNVAAGVQTVTFNSPFPANSDYTLPPLVGVTADGELIWHVPDRLSFTDEGFDVNFDVPVTLSYVATLKK